MLYTEVSVGSVAVVDKLLNEVVATLIEKFSAGTSGVPTVKVSPLILPG